MRAIAEYKLPDRKNWSVALGAEGESYDELARYLSQSAGAVAVRPRDGRVADKSAAGFRGCSVCGSSYWAKRRDARFCSAGCRQRASRSRRRDLAPPATTSGAGIETLADLLDSGADVEAPLLSAYEVFGVFHGEHATPRAAVKASTSTNATPGGASSSTSPNREPA